MALPKSVKDILNYDPSKEFGGTYNPSKNVDVKVGIVNGKLTSTGGGVTFRTGRSSHHHGGGSSSSSRRARDAAKAKATADAKAKIKKEAEEKTAKEKADVKKQKLAEQQNNLLKYSIQTRPSNNPNKTTVILPTGNQVDINSYGRTIVGSQLAGERLIFQDGILRKVNGEDLYKEKLAALEIKKTNGMVSKDRALSLIKDYTARISTIESSLAVSAQNGDIQKLADLQRKKNLTPVEKAEKERLQKIVANNYKKVGEMVGLTMASTVLGFGLGSINLAKNLVKDPVETTKRLPGDLWDGIKQDYTRIKSGPTGALNVAVEYVTLVGSLKGIGKLSGGTVKLISKLNPKYVKMVDGEFVLRKAPSEIFKVRGNTRLLSKRVLSPSFKRPLATVADFLKGRKPGQFKKFTKDPGLILRSQTVATGAKKLSGQAKLAGKEVTAVNAAADQLTSWLKRKKIIRKPIPGEADFPLRTKEILKKFDSGNKLTTKEFAEVNLWLQKNVAPNITLLERSLYLDPASGLRISRLGIQKTKTASLKDIMRGNFKLWNKSNKPQVLIFENAKIAKFPKSLNSIKKKLLADKPLTTAETNKLIAWQIKTGGGKFKPIGSTIYNLGKELEITLAPGEFVKRIKKVGFTYIEGKKVNFVTAKIFKPSKTLLIQIKKANLGKLTKIQLSALERKLSKLLGRNVKVETPSLKKVVEKSVRKANSNIPVLRVKGNGIFVIRGLRSIGRVSKTVGRKLSRTTKRPSAANRGKVTPAKRKTSKRPSKRTVKKTSRVKPKRAPVKRKPVRPPSRPSKTPPKKPPVIKLPKKFTTKTLSKKVPVFYVKERVRGKIINLTPRPLQLSVAKDFLAYRLDTRLSRSGWFEPMGKARRVVKVPIRMKGYFNRNSKKLRPFKIRVGVKKSIRRGYIEKRAYALDKISERNQMSRLRNKKVVRRKMTPAQKKILVARLRKGRMTKTKGIKVSTTKRRARRTRPTASKITIKRKITPKQQRLLRLRLKRARAVRMRNLRK